MKIPKIEGRRARNDGISRVIAGGFICSCCMEYYPSWSEMKKMNFKHSDNLYIVCGDCIDELYDAGLMTEEMIIGYLITDKNINSYFI